MIPRVLCITITRDGLVNPSVRLPDKHVRLFHGRTLDEWFAIRCWSSKYCTHWAIVGETEEHCKRLLPLAEKYGGEVVCRPPAHLHPMEDTGGQPMRWGMHAMVREHGPYNIVLQNFVVNPVWPPGLWDQMVERFMELAQNPETYGGPPVMSMVHRPQEAFYESTDNGRIRVVGPVTTNTGRSKERWATTDGITIGTPDYYDWSWAKFQAGDWSLTYGGQGGVLMMEVPWWTDVHIDTPDEWELAESLFGRYIGVGDVAAEKYRTYREGWTK